MPQDSTAEIPAKDDEGLSTESGPMISVVIPCLNEEESVAQCVEKALRGIEASGLSGEVVVVDRQLRRARQRRRRPGGP